MSQKNVVGRKKIIGKGLNLFSEVEEVNEFWCILGIKQGSECPEVSPEAKACRSPGA